MEPKQALCIKWITLEKEYHSLGGKHTVNNEAIILHYPEWEQCRGSDDLCPNSRFGWTL